MIVILALDRRSARACAKLVKNVLFKDSSRNRPLKLSSYALYVGLPSWT
jgi:hypothetical protein